jgi:glycosyltransferase involved in cell wall biosynthesis
VLVLLGCFRAGHEATGPNQSMIGMAQLLGPRFRFRVIAVDKAQSKSWTEVAGVEQTTVRPGLLGTLRLRRLLRSTPHELLVMNSIFDPALTIPALILRRLGLVPRRPALLAPRGEFSGGALALKSTKKRLHLQALRWLGLLRGVSLQATSDDEAASIRAGLPEAHAVLVGPNVRAVPPLPPHLERRSGEPLRLAFLGRIVPIKNLEAALDALARAGEPARFDIFGPIEDPEYWRACSARIAAMPSHVEVRHLGLLRQSEVVTTLARYDLLLLPTRGENFGHAIFESLAAGTPVLISDQTPWRGLEKESAGWDVPLDRPDLFAVSIARCAAWSDEERDRVRAGARALAEHRLASAETAGALAQCLISAMAAGGFEDGAALVSRLEESPPAR